MVTAAAALTFGIAACGADGPGGEGPALEAQALEEAEAEVEVLLSNPALEVEPLTEAPPQDMEVAAVTCTVTSCKPGEFTTASEQLGWDVSEENYDLTKGPSDFVAAVRRALQSDDLDALAILFVYPPELIADELQEARDRGIVLVDVASAIDAPPEGFISCIACNPALRANGAAEANYVAVDAGSQTTVGLVGDKTIDANVSATEGFVEEFERVAPEGTVVDINVSFAATPQANAQTVVSALQRNPDIAYLVFQSPDHLRGMDQALGAAGLTDQVTMIGLDPAGQEQVDLVTSGGVDAWVGADGPVIWWRAVDAIARNAIGDPVDITPIPALRVINADNLEDGMFAPRDYQAAFADAWGLNS